MFLLIGIRIKTLVLYSLYRHVFRGNFSHSRNVTTLVFRRTCVPSYLQSGISVHNFSFTEGTENLNPEVLSNKLSANAKNRRLNIGKICNVSNVVEHFPDLKDHSEDDVQNACEVLRILLKRGLSLDDIKTHVWILLYKPNKINSKLTLLNEFGISEVSIPLLRIKEGRLKRIKYMGESQCLHPFPHRVAYLSHHLEISETEVIKLFERRPYMLTTNLLRIHNVLKIVKEAGFTGNDIIRDLRVFQIRENIISDRITRAKAANIPLKIWMLRCLENVFCNSLEKWNQNQCALGKFKDQVEYLAHRLECDKDTILKVAKKYKQVIAVRPLKLKQMLDFLFEKGFTPFEICERAYILNSSMATLQKRITALESINQVPSLLVLGLTSEEFNRRITSQSFSRSRKKKLQDDTSMKSCSSKLPSSVHSKENELSNIMWNPETNEEQMQKKHNHFQNPS